MAGDGPLLEPCRDLVKSLNLEQCIQFLGIIGHHSVAEEVRSSRAFLQHSVVAADGDSEGTPVGILEAGCSGIPVIASRHAGIADVVIEGKTGILFDERDVDAMAEAILFLGTHPEEASNMGRLARMHVCEHYAIELSIGKLARLL
jgi:glycosyltransferase involved in cell wall biosynthesis